MRRPQQPLVYAIVLNYCSLEDTLCCIETVRAIDYPSLRLLVIDNNSPDGSGFELAKRLPAREFVQLSSNTGYAGGNNIGFSIALSNRADYVFVVNPDVRLRPDSISTYVKILESDKSIGALNPIQLSPDGKSTDPSFAASVMANMSPLIKGNPFELREARTLLGAALFLPARVIEDVGGFDPLFFAYGEEEDYCRRIRCRGYGLVVTALAPVIHARTREKQSVSDFVLFLRLKGSYLYKLKDPKLGFPFALKFFFKDVFMDFLRRRPREYPFNKYSIGFVHILRAFFWVLSHTFSIREHRHLDRTKRPYISDADTITRSFLRT